MTESLEALAYTVIQCFMGFTELTSFSYTELTVSHSMFLQNMIYRKWRATSMTAASRWDYFMRQSVREWRQLSIKCDSADSR